jgi:hypothetical protein
MKTVLILLSAFSFAILCSGQDHFPCEDSRIGKLTTKSLLKDGIIHYEQAIKDVQKIKHIDGVYFVKIDSMQQTCVFRSYYLSKDSMMELSFTYSHLYDHCNYFFLISGKKDYISVRLSDDGEVENLNADDYSPIDKTKQKQVDALLKYFE